MKRTATLWFLATLVATSTVRAQELKPGDTLSQQNWQLAKDLLPPEILRHYERGEYVSPILAWENGRQKWSADFLEATARNATELALDAKGSIVDKATGKRPAYMRGFPFPNVTADDPQAALKILWNHYLYWWNNGNLRNYVEINWVSSKGVERKATQDVYFLYYQGQPRQYIPTSNPDDLLTQLLATTVKPADLNGTAALSWRYRDPEKRDSSWAYVPALRRVRAVSPTNRSDGFLGSDMSQDDGPFFDGKPEDFNWKLAGEQDILRLTDPYSLDGEQHRVQLPSGGWRGIWKKVPMVGFQDPSWQGSPWAPLGTALARRRCWVIEAVPKDTYYLFGKIQLYIDKETYHGAYNRKFNWSGELVNIYVVFADLNGSSGGDGDYYGAGNIVYQGAENLKLSRATVITAPPDQADPPNDRRIKLDPQFFSAQSLVRAGK
ncbi:MAG: DUF1329 domain-containing protein [Deltaproteobacteria bacterium]|nr:DUF1329 domain-containing protein [Deltaproteobacteria bacterium]